MTESALAYAKINISLDIISKREDGYHDLCTVMQTIDLSDELTVECKPGDGISVETNLSYLPGNEQNIAAKAAAAYYDHTGIKGNHTKIIIKKNIPVCAGLGGGSTDGACVLKLLDRLYKTELGNRKLEEIGILVGSDVPFCIEGGTKLVEGRGERLTSLQPLPDSYIVICKPAFQCSTPELFKRVKCKKIQARPDTSGLLKAIDEGNINGIAKRMYNVFEDLLPHGKSDIEEIKSAMLDHNALGAVMTGSGPSVLGLFNNKLNAIAAYEQLKAYYTDCYMSETVNPKEHQ